MKVETRSLRDEHSPEAIRAKLSESPRHSYLRDFVYGAIDGTVTTFAVVSGVAGAGLSHGIVLVLGCANLAADGFSMAASNYLGTRSEAQLRDRVRRMEERHIEHYPEGEREEVRQIFASKGFSGDDLERAVEVVTGNRAVWVDTMLREEHGLALAGPEPVRAALVTFVAFVAVGFLPLAAFVYNYSTSGSLERPYLWSSLLAGVAFFGVGAAKGKVVEQSWYVSGLETLLLGSAASALAYLIGSALRGLLGP